jgi:hypothetical protein
VGDSAVDPFGADRSAASGRSKIVLASLTVGRASGADGLAVESLAALELATVNLSGCCQYSDRISNGSSNIRSDPQSVGLLKIRNLAFKARAEAEDRFAAIDPNPSNANFSIVDTRSSG